MLSFCTDPSFAERLSHASPEEARLLLAKAQMELATGGAAAGPIHAPWLQQAVEALADPSARDLSGRLAEVGARLELLCRTLATRPALAVPDRGRLASILSSEAFAHRVERAGLGDFVQDLLERLLRFLQGSAAVVRAAEVFQWIFLGLLIAAALAFGLRLLRQHRRKRTRATAIEPVERRLRPAEDHLAAACAAHRQGQLRSAVRHRFLAVLSRLEEAGLVGYGRYKTNREYVQELARRRAPAPVIEAMERLVATYDPIWYGQQAIDEAGYAACAARCDAVLEAVARGAGEREAA